MIQNDKARIQKRRQERSEEGAKETKNRDIAQAIESNRPGNKIANATSANERFAGVADEPAENHVRRNVALELDQPMRGQGCQQQNPPRPSWG